MKGHLKRDYDALGEVFSKLPTDRQDALQEWIDEQEQDETENAGGSDTASDD
jgi:hypothetical protein